MGDEDGEVNLQVLKSHLYKNDGYSEHGRDLIRAIAGTVDVTIIDDIDEPLNLEGTRISKRNDPDIPLLYITPSHHRYEPVPMQTTLIRTMFESDHIHPNWADKFNRADKVIVPCEFNYNTFLNSGVERDRLAVLRDGIDINIFKKFPDPFPLKTKKRFKFLSIFSAYGLFHRKGVDLLINAYREMFTEHDDVCLVIKTDIKGELLFQKLGVDPRQKGPDIEVISDMLTVSQLMGLYHAADAYVLPARGEAIGRPYLYAMLKGIPVIGTNWSGNTEFMTPENANLLDYQMTEIGLGDNLPIYYGGKLAEPSVEQLKFYIRDIYDDPDKYEQKVNAARKTIEDEFSYPAVASALKSILKGTIRLPRNTDHSPFFRLLPLRLGGKDRDILEDDRRIQKRGIRRVVVYGTGSSGRSAADWLTRFNELEPLHFIDREVNASQFQGFSLSRFDKMETEGYDILVIAADIRFIASILGRLEERVKIPIYWFY